MDRVNRRYISMADLGKAMIKAAKAGDVATIQLILHRTRA
jgi:hypothetical protein